MQINALVEIRSMTDVSAYVSISAINLTILLKTII